MVSRTALALVVGLLVAGCSKTGDACTSSAQCGSDQSCVYPVAGGCDAQSTCQDNPTGPDFPGLVITYCGCDGGTVNTGGSGYAPQPVAGPTCPPTADTSPDAGDAGSD
jgi:hypothetical protein